VRQAEQWTAVLVFSVLGCFIIDLFISQPPIGAVISGLIPRLHRNDIYCAVSLLGANIMPHNFYLHSALVSGQSSRDDKVTARRCYLNSLDVTCALGLALLVNVAVLLVSASAFHAAGELPRHP
jgi:NRAMP (natural resistance-associated macrophage protein)-like metal ion transporter